MLLYSLLSAACLTHLATAYSDAAIVNDDVCAAIRKTVQVTVTVIVDEAGTTKNYDFSSTTKQGYIHGAGAENVPTAAYGKHGYAAGESDINNLSGAHSRGYGHGAGKGGAASETASKSKGWGYGSEPEDDDDYDSNHGYWKSVKSIASRSSAGAYGYPHGKPSDAIDDAASHHGYSVSPRSTSSSAKHYGYGPSASVSSLRDGHAPSSRGGHVPSSFPTLSPSRAPFANSSSHSFVQSPSASSSSPSAISSSSLSSTAKESSNSLVSSSASASSALSATSSAISSSSASSDISSSSIASSSSELSSSTTSSSISSSSSVSEVSSVTSFTSSASSTTSAASSTSSAIPSCSVADTICLASTECCDGLSCLSGTCAIPLTCPASGGSFEDVPDGNLYNVGFTTPSGWFFGNQAVPFPNGNAAGYTTPFGNVFLDFFGFSNSFSELTKTITVNVGATYTLSYAYAVQMIDGTPPSCPLVVTYANTIIDTFTFTPAMVSLNDWQPHSATFVPTVASGVLRFRMDCPQIGGATSYIDTTIDNIAVTLDGATCTP